MTQRIRSYRFSLVAAAALLLSGCSSHGVKVLDLTTHQPVAGAWVSYSRYTEGVIFSQGVFCKEVNVGKTDLGGHVRLSVSSPFNLLNTNTYGTNVYMPGHEVSSDGRTTYYLRPFTGTPAQRLEQLRLLSWSLDECDDNKASLPMQQAIAEESLSIVNHLEGAYGSGSPHVAMPIKESEAMHDVAKYICQDYGTVGVVSSSHVNREQIDERMTDEWLELNSPACYAEVTRPILKAGEWCERWSDEELCQTGVFIKKCPSCRETFEPTDENIGPPEIKRGVVHASRVRAGAARASSPNITPK